jgi:hypothetical protein
MTRLVNLRLSQNSLTGAISSSLSRLSHLEIVHLVDNKFNGSIPNAFDRMRLLKELHVQDNTFSGVLPGSLGSLKKLKRLALEDNNLTGSVPKSVCALKDVGDLVHLSANCIPKGQRPALDIHSSTDSATTVIDLSNLNNRNLQLKQVQVSNQRYAQLGMQCSCCTWCNSATASPKISYPEVVGMKGEDAKLKLETDNPNMEVVLCGLCATKDFKKDRIRIFVNDEGIVEEPPLIG